LETTGTSPYYVDEDYPAGPEISEPLAPWTKRLTWLKIAHSRDWLMKFVVCSAKGESGGKLYYRASVLSCTE